MSAPAPPSPVAAPLDALTGLRFLAAAAVVWFHFGRHAWGLGPAWVQTISGHGYLAVNLFFVLSGFILTATYVGAGRLGPGQRGAYYLARFARIYPLYLAVFVAMLASGAWWPSSAAVLVPQALLLQGWLVHLPEVTDGGNFPAWSLTVEAFFYALFPFLPFARLARLAPAGLLAVGAAAWLAGLAAVALLLAWLPGSGLAPETGFALLRYLPPLHLPAFLAGVLAGLWYLAHGQSARAAAWRWAPLAAGVGMYVGVVLARKATPMAPIYLNAGLLVPCFVALVLGLALGDGPLRRVLGQPGMVALGQASYALYLLHVPLWLLLMRHGVVTQTAVTAPYQQFALYAGLLLPLSVAAWLLVEEPARRWLKPRLCPAPADRAERAAA